MEPQKCRCFRGRANFVNLTMEGVSLAFPKPTLRWIFTYFSHDPLKVRSLAGSKLLPGVSYVCVCMYT